MDTVVFLAMEQKYNFTYLLPYFHPINKEFIEKLPSPIRIFRSRLFRYLVGVFRDAKMVKNLTYNCNSFIEPLSIVRPIKRARYAYHEIDTVRFRSVIRNHILDSSILGTYSLNRGQYVCINARNNFLTERTAKVHSFRNSPRSYLIPIIEYLQEEGVTVVNLSTYFFRGCLNIHEEIKYSKSDILSIVEACKCYIGDSSGPTVYALCLGGPVFAYNFFPLIDDVRSNVTVDYMEILGDYTKDDLSFLHSEFDLIKYGISVRSSPPSLVKFANFWNKL